MLLKKEIKKEQDDYHQNYWHNLGKFQGLFGRNFAVVDNSRFLNPKDAAKKFGMITKKYIDNFIKKPIRNHIGRQWVNHQLHMKRLGMRK